MKKLESGRSMVEMLGVLAIIGVLSIGGIAGYTLSMRRHRANQVLDAANKYAMVLYSVCQKALVDGYISEFDFCANVDLPSFADSGVNPVGDITKIEVSSISGTHSDVDNFTLSIYLNDLTLCKTIDSIAGAKVWKISNCKENNTHVAVDFKMN